MTRQPTIGFVGPGTMGLPMVGRLAAAGLVPHVFARRSEVAEQVVALGGDAVSWWAGLAGAQVVILCLFSETQVDEVVAGPDGLVHLLAPGAVIVSHTTGSRSAVEHLAQVAAAADLQFVDAPVSGTAAAIEAGRLTVLVGGAETALDLCRPALETYSATILPTGAVGTATALKLVNNALFAANSQLAAAALALADQQGIDASSAMIALRACSGASAALGYMAGVGGPDEFATQALPYLRKDVAAVRDHAQQHGLDLGVIATAIAGGPLGLT